MGFLRMCMISYARARDSSTSDLERSSMNLRGVAERKVQPLLGSSASQSRTWSTMWLSSCCRTLWQQSGEPRKRTSGMGPNSLTSPPRPATGSFSGSCDGDTSRPCASSPAANRCTRQREPICKRSLGSILLLLRQCGLQVPRGRMIISSRMVVGVARSARHRRHQH